MHYQRKRWKKEPIRALRVGSFSVRTAIQRQTFLLFFKKGVDKSPLLWYNVYRSDE